MRENRRRTRCFIFTHVRAALRDIFSLSGKKRDFCARIMTSLSLHPPKWTSKIFHPSRGSRGASARACTGCPRYCVSFSDCQIFRWVCHWYFFRLNCPWSIFTYRTVFIIWKLILNMIDDRRRQSIYVATTVRSQMWKSERDLFVESLRKKRFDNWYLVSKNCEKRSI